MPPKKQGDRIADLETKLEMVLKKLELEIPPEETTNEEHDNVDEKDTGKTENQLPQPLSSKERVSRSRTRQSKSSLTTDDEEEFTPKNLRRRMDRARSHTPMTSQRMYSTKDVLNDRGMQNRAQQILELLNPQIPQGKALDSYSSKTARFIMP